MAKIYIDDNKKNNFHTILSHWTHGDKEPHLINVIATLRGWSSFKVGECAEIVYGDEKYYIERKQ